MKQAPGFDGLLFDPFSLSQDGLAAPEVDISRGEVQFIGVRSPYIGGCALGRRYNIEL